MIFSTNALRFVLVLVAACNPVASVDTVDLGIAGTATDNYVILAKTGISSVPNSAITGNIAVSPIAATAITGFSLTMDLGGQFSTSSQIAAGANSGQAYAASYGGDIETRLTTAVSDMELAYIDAASRDNTATNPMDGLNAFTTGVYTFAENVLIGSDITFDGDANHVFIIQISGNLEQAGGKEVILSGGALAENIFWQVAGTVAVGATAKMKGILLAGTAVTFGAQSSLNGRVLTQTSCALDQVTITA
jgi:hypothetical protein